MRNLVFLITVFCFGLLACNSNGNEEVVITDSVTSDSSNIPIANDNRSKPSADLVVGYYKGVIPCADCSGIDHAIMISPDMKFRLSETYLGKNANPFTSEGKWNFVDDSTIQVLVKDSIVGNYRASNGQLLFLGQSGVPITGPLAKNYILRKVDLAEANSAWKRKKAAGIDFLVLGNEPFWSVEIDIDKQITFLLADRGKPEVFPYSKPSIQGNSIFYDLKNDSTRITITVDRAFCSDGMSDNWYEYAVKVVYNEREGYSGCGVRLSDSWAR